MNAAQIATHYRRLGHYASAECCLMARDEAWAAARLERTPDFGDYALLAEVAASQVVRRHCYDYLVNPGAQWPPVA